MKIILLTIKIEHLSLCGEGCSDIYSLLINGHQLIL